MLVDTSALLRTLQPLHPQREIVRSAIKVLIAQGRKLHIVSQNLVELWVVATRPLAQNGLGMSTVLVAAELERLKGIFLFLPETAAIYPLWEALVIENQVSGKPAHDARLVAAMLAHGLTAILTFDRTGFSRYPDIEVVHPERVAPEIGPPP